MPATGFANRRLQSASTNYTTEILGTSQQWKSDNGTPGEQGGARDSRIYYTWSTPQNFSADTVMAFNVSAITGSWTMYVVQEIPFNGNPIFFTPAPITATGLHMMTLNAAFGIDVTEISLRVGVSVGSFPGASITIDGTVQIICFPGSTLVTMADRTQKSIRDIQPGDRVVSRDGAAHEVKTLLRTPGMPEMSLGTSSDPSHQDEIEMVEFPADCLGQSVPARTLHCTPHHPIFYQGVRKPAFAFDGHNGIHRGWFKKSAVLGDEEEEGEQRHWVYNLQFDHEASFLVESDEGTGEGGMEVQSHSPWHKLSPLAESERAPGDTETRSTCDALTLPQPYSDEPLQTLV